MRRVEEPEHRITHRRDDVLVRGKAGQQQRDVFRQSCRHELLDEVDAHAAGEEDEHDFGLGGPQLCQFGGEIQLTELDVDLVGAVHRDGHGLAAVERAHRQHERRVVRAARRRATR